MFDQTLEQMNELTNYGDCLCTLLEWNSPAIYDVLPPVFLGPASMIHRHPHTDTSPAQLQ